MSGFKLVSEFAPTGDQPQAIEKLVKAFRSGKKAQTLLGVTGSGKTFTMANVIKELNRLQLNFMGSLRNSSLRMRLSTSFHTTITTSQRPMFLRQIHISRKIQISMQRLRS